MSEANVIRVKTCLSAVGVIGGVWGMLWLASVITARPEETMRLAAKFGGAVWIFLAAISLVMLGARKLHQRGRSSAGAPPANEK